MSVLQLGIPKGSLQQSTVEMFYKAGYRITVNSRSYYPEIDDEEIECMLIRAQEMARYVEEGILDVGLTGRDWIEETGADVLEVTELVYGKVGRSPLRWVLAVPEDSGIEHVKDLEGKIDMLFDQVEKISQTEPYKEKVDMLRCFKGIDTLIAINFVIEIGDFRRFMTVLMPRGIGTGKGMDNSLTIFFGGRVKGSRVNE